MNLKLKRGWVARDKDGDQFWSKNRPVKRVDEYLKIQPYACIPDCIDLDIGPDWQESLHEVLDDGTLRKVVERPDLKMDDIVVVWGIPTKQVMRHFCRWENDRIAAFTNGASSVTSDDSSPMLWEFYRIPTQQEIDERRARWDK